MGKHESGYDRIDKDFYPSPPWVIEALAEHVDLKGKGVWEPACGDGLMSVAIKAAGAAYVYSTDVVDRGFPGIDMLLDFVSPGQPSLIHYDAIVTNPPFGKRGKLAEAFIEAGLRRTRDCGLLALLLPADFDAAKSRRKFFADCPYFAGKITLTKRIKWFENGTNISPKENHAWFLWQRTWIGDRQIPRIRYAPTPDSILTEEGIGIIK